jgi:hypothetical protein
VIDPADCWHEIRCIGARELARRRRDAGWPRKPCSAERGWHVVCKRCLQCIGCCLRVTGEVEEL